MSAQHFAEDNYLPEDRYREHLPDADGFARFQNPDNDQWYFAYYHGEELLFRSEGYANEPGRDNGIESVKTNKDDDNNYKLVHQPDGMWVLTLHAQNLKEIARTCRFDDENEARLRFPRALLAHSRTPEAAPEAAREDDYLKCKDYEGHARSDEHPEFTVFEKEGEYYFALVDDGGNVQMRSEGYTTPEAREKGMQSVLNNKSNRDRYKVEEHLGYYFVILNAANYKEIARSCPLTQAAALALIDLLTGAGIGAAIAAAPLVAETKSAMAPPPPASDGVKWWWWLLPLLLLALLYLLWRSCNVEKVPVKSAGPVYVSEEQCGWHPILFAFDSDSITAEAMGEIRKVADVMRSNPNHRALFIGFTDSLGTTQYNVDLSLRRATAAKNAAIGLGVNGAKISTSEEDEYNPVATNKEEAGRMYNRRVVMYVLDSDNRLVCKQIELEIPRDLRAK